MNILREIRFLLQKELTLEFRQKYAISGILLYVFSTIFVIYLAVGNADGRVWNILYWIIILFASTNAIAKSFLQESGNRQLYYYSLVNPIAIIISKMIYNTLLLLALSLLAYGVLSLVLGNPVKDQGLFFLIIFLASLGFSITFTFISAIASKANNSASLMAILGFPIIIPILMTLVNVSLEALGEFQGGAINDDITILLSIDLLLAGAALMLFPFLWKD